MSDFEIAIMRLNNWLHRHIDDGPKEFIGDLTIVLLAAKNIGKQTAENEDEQEQTSDEVRFVPGKCLHNERFWLWEMKAHVGCAMCDLDRLRATVVAAEAVIRKLYDPHAGEALTHIELEMLRRICRDRSHAAGDGE